MRFGASKPSTTASPHSSTQANSASFVRPPPRLVFLFFPELVLTYRYWCVIDTWAESGRDLLNFLLYYLPANPSSESEELPLYLERLPEAIAQSRREGGFVGERTLVGVGHSAGAASLYVLSLVASVQFSSPRTTLLIHPIARQVLVRPLGTTALSFLDRSRTHCDAY